MFLRVDRRITELPPPKKQAALDRFRTLASWRRERVWPMAATPCLEATTARQGNSLIITWMFEAGPISMAINPTGAPADMACVIDGPLVSTGSFSHVGDVLRLGPWSAVSW
ncbi:hypothetical protein [Devosia sp. CN2-171]|uniref:hypothetical protein n=1 Tax=Devosia sp. CN2-171 TaxID=3400909 RepID=UPI003BF91A83